MYTYPGAPVQVGPDLTTTQVHHLMKTPTLIAKRLADLSLHKFIADYLLAGRFTVEGGAILYETGEEIFPADSPEAVAPGAEYPKTVLTAGELATAKTKKWGSSTDVMDEAIKRLLMNPVDRAFLKLVNGMIRHVDGVALAVIASKVVQEFASPRVWDDTSEDRAAGAIIDTVLQAKAKAEEDNLDLAFDYDTVVLRPTQFAKVAGTLIKSDLVPRESANVALTGVIPSYLGLTWTTSPHVPFSQPLLVDRNQLGGMADEDLESPDYVSRNGIDVLSERIKGRDKYTLQARRVTVPVVIEPRAAIKITGTGF